ncbi:MAG: hypothetical protein ABI876_14680, partial [Bacteroidota bacterium]
MRMEDHVNQQRLFWTAEDEQILRRDYLDYGAEHVARLVGRSSVAVMQHARHLGLRMKENQRAWTDAEDAVLREQYGSRGGQSVADQLGRTLMSVRRRAVRLGIVQPGARWSQEDLATLRNEFDRTPIEELAQRLGRTPLYVSRKALELGLRSGRTAWSEQEIDQLRELYGRLSPTEIGDRLRRKASAVKAMASRIGIAKPLTVVTEGMEKTIVRQAGRVSQHALAKELGISWSRLVRIAREHGIDTSVRWWRNPWSAEEDAYLRRHYQTTPMEEIAVDLDRSRKSVVHRMNKLGLPVEDRYHSRMVYWTTEQDDVLRKQYQKMSVEELAEKLGRTRDAIIKRLAALDLRVNPARGKKPPRWTSKEDATMRLLYRKLGSRELSKRLGRSVDAIQARARTLGVTKRTTE